VPHKEWVENLVKFSSRSSFISLLLDSKVAFIVDGSFYLTKLYLISVAWFATVDKPILSPQL